MVPQWRTGYWTLVSDSWPNAILQMEFQTNLCENLKDKLQNFLQHSFWCSLPPHFSDKKYIWSKKLSNHTLSKQYHVTGWTWYGKSWHTYVYVVNLRYIIWLDKNLSCSFIITWMSIPPPPWSPKFTTTTVNSSNLKESEMIVKPEVVLHSRWRLDVNQLYTFHKCRICIYVSFATLHYRHVSMYTDD